jgi:hypothetical protein
VRLSVALIVLGTLSVAVGVHSHASSDISPLSSVSPLAEEKGDSLSSVLPLVREKDGPLNPLSPFEGERVRVRGAASEIVANGNVEHGRYLSEHVAMCVECHSGRDTQGNIIPAERYMGGAVPPGPAWATDWAMRAPRNKGLLGYSDDQALRLLMQGAINREGRQLQPPMPRFRMTQQDAADVIAFLRSTP